MDLSEDNMRGEEENNSDALLLPSFTSHSCLQCVRTNPNREQTVLAKTLKTLK